MVQNHNFTSYKFNVQLFAALIIGWTIFISISLYHFYTVEQRHAYELAASEGRARFNKDIAFRRWASRRGGCYVEVSKETPPNPYLTNIPERDIKTPSGKQLTLMNPAYMLRSLYQLQGELFGDLSKITSLNYLNPFNAPDAWEKDVLHRFEHGEREVSDVVKINGVPHMRMMSAMIMEQSCVKCHPLTINKIGEPRGGIGITVSMKPYLDRTHLITRELTYFHVAIWILGVAILLLIYQKRKQAIKEINDHEEQMVAANVEMKKAKERAEESDRLKSAFLSNMSHEIRTPMNGIIGSAQLLNDAHLTEEKQKQYVAIINQSSQRLLHTINDILDLSRIDAGQAVINVTHFPVYQTLKELFAVHENLFKNKKIELVLSVNPQHFSLMLLSDEQKIYQILDNLINNAYKFTKSGKVEFGFKRIDHYLEFFVKDTGIGIPKDKLPLMFGRFVQADQAIDRGYEGSGLGLAISKGLVNLLGGKIWLESEVNVGTTFKFVVPFEELKSGEAHNQFDAVQKSVEESARTIDWSQKTFLIVEDDLNNYLILESLLKKHTQVKILHAENGEEALKIFKNNASIDLIMMDLKMPVMDGFQATKRIRELNTTIPIIAVTAYALDEERTKALKAGCNRVLSKPYDVITLLTILGNLLGK